MSKRKDATGVGRRGFLKGAALAGAATTVAAPLGAIAQLQQFTGRQFVIVDRERLQNVQRAAYRTHAVVDLFAGCLSCRGRCLSR